MTNIWQHYYCYGEFDALLQWLIDTFPCTDPDHDRPYQLPAEVAFRGPYLYPQRQTGTVTDDEGNEYPVYARIKSRSDILCLIAVTDPSQLDDVPGKVHQCSKEEIAELYPKHALGQAIPYIC